MVGRGTGDSSESHDTDHLADEEILDDTDSPLVVSKEALATNTARAISIFSSIFLSVL